MSDQDRASRVQAWFSGRTAGPFILQLNPTMACNLNCLFCRRQDGLRDYYKTHRELSNAKYFEIVADAAALGVSVINIKGGGEPLLRRSLVKELVRRIKSSGMSGSLITNGTVIDDELAEVFAASHWDEISISLDGPDPTTQDFLRDKAGVFDQIMGSIGRLMAAKKRRGGGAPHLKFHLVLTNRNCRGLERFAWLAHELGVGEIEIDSLNPSTDSAGPLVLSPADNADFQGALPAAIKLADALGLRHNLRDFARADYVFRTERAPEAPTAKDKAACYFPWFHANLTTDGRLAPCCYGETYQTHVTLHDHSFKDAWLGVGMRRIREAMLDGSMMPFCKECTAGYRDHSARVGRLAFAALAEAPRG